MMSASSSGVTLEGEPLSDIEMTGQAVPVPVNEA